MLSRAFLLTSFQRLILTRARLMYVRAKREICSACRTALRLLSVVDCLVELSSRGSFCRNWNSALGLLEKGAKFKTLFPLHVKANFSILMRHKRENSSGLTKTKNSIRLSIQQKALWKRFFPFAVFSTKMTINLPKKYIYKVPHINHGGRRSAWDEQGSLNNLSLTQIRLELDFILIERNLYALFAKTTSIQSGV